MTMNCEHCQAELEDFLYGELGPARAAAVKTHLAGCADCRRARADLGREAELFAGYHERTALEPTPEMWEQIRTRIEADGPAPGRGATGWLGRLSLLPLLQPAVLRQLAFGALLVGVSVAATAIYLRERRPEPRRPEISTQTTPTPVPGSTPAVPDATPAPTAPPQIAAVKPKPRAPKLSEEELIGQQVARAEREYQGAIRLLDRAIARRRDGLGPAILAQYQSSLALIDGSIEASRRALRDHPRDPAAGQFLLAAYAKKVELMQEIAMH